MAKVLIADEVFQNFAKGANCAMQVFAAVAEDIDFSEEEAMQIATGFGGGIGLGSTCGCVTGALMALGYKYGCSEPGQPEQMAVFGEKKAAFISAFNERFGSTHCPTLLGGLNPAVPADKEQIGEKGLMRTVCAECVCAAVEILEDLI